METHDFTWRGRRVRWRRAGSGPPLVFCHGTPWSSWLWEPFAEALSRRFTVYLWDMPGYGESSKSPEHAVSLDIQCELFADLLDVWEVSRPHVIAHDFGGAVALRAHLLHGAAYSSLALVNVVALAPWGSPYFQLVRDNADVFAAVPPAVHEGAVRAYISTASHPGLPAPVLDRLVAPWLGEQGQPAFYRQIAQADQRFTDDIEPRYPTIDVPTLVVWGREDTWIPVDRAHRLAELIPNAELVLIDGAAHLPHLDQPVRLATELTEWVLRQAPEMS